MAQIRRAHIVHGAMAKEFVTPVEGKKSPTMLLKSKMFERDLLERIESSEAVCRNNPHPPDFLCFFLYGREGLPLMLDLLICRVYLFRC